MRGPDAPLLLPDCRTRPCWPSETLRPALGMPEGDGNASRYDGRERRLRPLRWEVRGVREYITDECCNRADRRLSSGAIDGPVHLCKKGNRNGRTNDPANRCEKCVLETERGRTFPRAITRKQASQAPPNFSAAGRANQAVRKAPDASSTLNLRLRIARPFGRFFHRRLLRYAVEKGK